MSDGTAIQWTDATWNPVRAKYSTTDDVGQVLKTGWHCERVSPGCQHCYAERINEKRFGTGLPYNRKSRDLVDIYLDEKALAQPLRWRRPRKVFVCSMTDLFGEWVPDEMIDRVFAVMALSPQHTFQLLTKRPARMRRYLSNDDRMYVLRSMIEELTEGYTKCRWPLPNVWLGVSVEDQQRADERIPELLATPAAVRFVSCEPLLGPVDIRPYLGYHPIHEAADDERERSLPGGSVGGIGNRQRGQDLADGAPPLESLATSVRVTPGGPPEGGESHYRRISSGARDGGRKEGSRLGASTGLPPLQRPYSAGNEHQPQERRQGRQSAGELRTGDALREHGALPTSAQAWPTGSGRPTQRHGEADPGAGGGDSDTAGGWREADIDRDGLWSEDADGFEDSSRRSLGSVALSWIIAGGESGPGARPCDVEWIRSIVRQCQEAGVAVFYKQGGAANRCPHDRKGGHFECFPDDLKVREFPNAIR